MDDRLLRFHLLIFKAHAGQGNRGVFSSHLRGVAGFMISKFGGNENLGFIVWNYILYLSGLSMSKQILRSASLISSSSPPLARHSPWRSLLPLPGEGFAERNRCAAPIHDHSKRSNQPPRPTIGDSTQTQPIMPPLFSLFQSRHCYTCHVGEGGTGRAMFVMQSPTPPR